MTEATPIETAVEVREWLETQEAEREQRCTKMAEEAHALRASGADVVDVVRGISKFLVQEIIRTVIKMAFEKEMVFEKEAGRTAWSAAVAQAAKVEEAKEVAEVDDT